MSKVTAYRWWHPDDKDWLTVAETDSEPSDVQLLSWGYIGKIAQFVVGTEPTDFTDPVEVVRWFHPSDKDWITLALGEISDSQMQAWGYTNKTHQCFASRSPFPGGLRIRRWFQPVDKDWISLSDPEHADSQLLQWGYRDPMTQFYAECPPDWTPNQEIYPRTVSARTPFIVSQHGFRFYNSFVLVECVTRIEHYREFCEPA
jgi:hypothetical protein